MPISLLPKNPDNVELVNDQTPNKPKYSGGEDIAKKFVENSKKFIEYQTQTNNSFANIQKQIAGLQSQIVVLSNGIGNVAKLIQEDADDEQKFLQSQIETGRLSSIRETRKNRENALEGNSFKGIPGNVLAEPINNAKKSLEGIFSRIKRIVGAILLGYIGSRAIQLIGAIRDGDKEKIEELTKELSKNISYILGAFAAWKIGIRAISFALKQAIKGTLNLLAKGIGKIFRSVFNRILPDLKPKTPRTPNNTDRRGRQKGGKKTPKVTTGKGGTNIKSGSPNPKITGNVNPKKSWFDSFNIFKNKDAVNKPKGGTGIASGSGKVLRGGSRALGRSLIVGDVAMTAYERNQKGQSLTQNAVGTTAEVASGLAGAKSLAAGGAALGMFTGPLAPITVPVFSITGGIIGYTLFSSTGGKVADYFTGAGEGNKKDGQKAILNNKPVIWSKEKEEWIPDPEKSNNGGVSKQMPQMESGSDTSSKQMPQMESGSDTSSPSMTVPHTNFDRNFNQTSSGESFELQPLQSLKNITEITRNFSISPSDISSRDGTVVSPDPSKAKMPESIPAMEEPETNVVFVPPKTKSEVGSIGGSSSNTNIPLIRTNNPDNFYVLYSKSQFNVVE